MITVKFVSADETKILESHYRKASSRLIRERAHAILLSAEGRSVPDISTILRRTEKTIRSWIAGFNAARLSSIFTRYADNANASKLTHEQREEIKQVLQQSPSESGLPREFWTIEGIKSYLKAKFGIVYESDRSYHYLLQFSNLSFKLPSAFDIRRDDAFVEKRIHEIRHEIKPMLHDKDWEVLVSDEVRIVWESEIRRAWLKKGEKTVLKVHRSNDYQSFIGMLNLKTGTPHLYQLAWQNQETIISALKLLLKRYPQKRICLIWDNAKWHKGKLIRQELSADKSLATIHMINFPPYAPDRNPQEHVWRDAKDTIANTDCNSFKETIRIFKKAVLGRTYDYNV